MTPRRAILISLLIFDATLFLPPWPRPWFDRVTDLRTVQICDSTPQPKGPNMTTAAAQIASDVGVHHLPAPILSILDDLDRAVRECAPRHPYHADPAEALQALTRNLIRGLGEIVPRPLDPRTPRYVRPASAGPINPPELPWVPPQFGPLPGTATETAPPAPSRPVESLEALIRQRLTYHQTRLILPHVSRGEYDAECRRQARGPSADQTAYVPHPEIKRGVDMIEIVD